MSIPVEQLIYERYNSEDHKGMWIATEGNITEALLLRKAVERIEQLKEDLEDAEAARDDWEDSYDEAVAETVSEYQGMMDDFANRYNELSRQIKKIRHVADNTITVCDYFLKEEKNEQ